MNTLTPARRQKVLVFLKSIYLDQKQPAIIRQQALNAHTWLAGSLPVPNEFAGQMSELVAEILRKVRRRPARACSAFV